MEILRLAEKRIRYLAKQFRALAISGPRQSGKSTLVQRVFHTKPYISLENPDYRLLAETDPRRFLNQFPKGAILDEAQRVPVLFNYLQEILDKTKKDGLFILTGSNNYLMQENITQSLAGRIGLFDLLPLTIDEIDLFNRKKYSTDELILNGCYPEVYDKRRKPEDWFPSYIRTYIERDVKQLRNIDNTVLFNRFLQLCAGRAGQQLNISSLANAANVDVKTVNAWLSILQSSYIIYLLQPHDKNFNKRITKTAKLYFYDTGLACNLLGIHNEKDLSNSPFRGALFENYVLMELIKHKNNLGSLVKFYYWRENKGLETDIIMERGSTLIPIEIKSAQTYRPEHTFSLQKWMTLSKSKRGLLIYDGDLEFTTKEKIKVMNLRNAKDVFKMIS